MDDKVAGLIIAFGCFGVVKKIQKLCTRMEGSFDLVAFDIFDVWKKRRNLIVIYHAGKLKNITLIQESYNTTPEQFN